MNLRPTALAVVLAAAGGAAASRTFMPQPPATPALVAGTVRASAKPMGAAEVESGRRAVVYVAGEVVHPGVYHVPLASRAVDALQHAGGPTRLADLVAVNLAAPVEDGTEIVVPAKGSQPSSALQGGWATSGARRSHRHTRPSKRHRKRRVYDAGTRTAGVAAAGAAGVAPPVVDVNAADAASLETLPGIGPALAERIVSFRDVNGPFASGDELLDVAGMTQSKTDALMPYVTFR